MTVDLLTSIPADWKERLRAEFETEYFSELQSFLEQEMASEQVFPPRDEIFSALRLAPYKSVKVLLLGQDPYHDDGQAHGLCFSVRPGVKLPPSLRNIYKELEEDLGIPVSDCGFLENWAKQGVLMINAVLTVRAHEAASHQGRGWENFTDAIIREVNRKTEPVVFVLWGGHAAKKLALIDQDRHIVISSAHPSPLSAYRGFFGSRPFSKINVALEQAGHSGIDWAVAPGQQELPLF